MTSLQIKLGSFKFDAAQLNAEGGPVDLAVKRACRKVVDGAKTELTTAPRVDTGMLRNSITYEIATRGASGISAFVGTNVEYALYIHNGTAQNGTGWIYPRTARVLRFKPKGTNTFRFAPKVKGIVGVPFLTRPLERLRPEDFA